MEIKFKKKKKRDGAVLVDRYAGDWRVLKFMA